MLVGVLGLALLGLRRESLLTVVLCYQTTFAGLLWTWWRHREWLDRPRNLLGVALVLRLLLAPVTADLSDDPARYLWDGWLSASGLSPYAFRPSDPALAAFAQGPLLSRLNSPDYYSVYPPLSQALFALGGWVYACTSSEALGLMAIKAALVLCELLGVVALAGALRRLGGGVAPLALYAWNPLVLVTIAGQGHSEGALVLGLGLGAFGLSAARPGLAWCGLALAVLAKLVPLAAAPLWLRHLGPRGAGLALAVTAALALPFWHPDAPAHVGESLDLYVRLFEFNAGLYYALKAVAWSVLGEDPSKALGPALRGTFLAWALGVGLLHPAATPRQVLRGSLLVFAGYLVTATTVHPWYAVLALALLPFAPEAAGPWLWLSGASVLTYGTYVGWPHGPLVAAVWLPFFGLAALDLTRGALLEPLLRRRGARKAAQIAPHVLGPRLLDLGCAEGWVALALEAPDRTVVLADIVDARRTRAPFVRHDGARLPFRDGAFDTVVLSLVLHHAADPDAVLREASRVARARVVVTESTYEGPAGRLLLTCLDRLANSLREGAALGAFSAPLSFRTVQEWQNAFARAGLRLRATRWLNRRVHLHVLFELEPTRPAAAGEVLPG
ncbi:MAG: class I SAM-dependent methyltransferase [Planctomycetes bacterium]|nr:class I SAM-dependent methyltransferase [Planctomycetota bacterium]